MKLCINIHVKCNFCSLTLTLACQNSHFSHVSRSYKNGRTKVVTFDVPPHRLSVCRLYSGPKNHAKQLPHYVQYEYTLHTILSTLPLSIRIEVSSIFLNCRRNNCSPLWYWIKFSSGRVCDHHLQSSTRKKMSSCNVKLKCCFATCMQFRISPENNWQEIHTSIESCLCWIKLKHFSLINIRCMRKKLTLILEVIGVTVSYVFFIISMDFIQIASKS